MPARRASEEAAEKQRQEQREAAAQVIAESRAQRLSPTLKLSDTVEKAKVVAMSGEYNSQYRVYSNRPFARTFSTFPPKGSKSYGDFLRAALQADQLGVSYELYVKAQFYWFDQWFSRAPKSYELASFKTKCNSLERVRLYEKEISAGNARATRSIFGRERLQPKLSDAVRLSASERTLRTLMRNHKASEEEVLRVFAKGAQAGVYFDRKWLQLNPTYQRLKAAGDV
jgi:hypothetical protein